MQIAQFVRIAQNHAVRVSEFVRKARCDKGLTVSLRGKPLPRRIVNSAKLAHLTHFLRVDARYVCVWASASRRAIASGSSPVSALRVNSTPSHPGRIGGSVLNDD
jgi:hypothetical protein